MAAKDLKVALSIDGAKQVASAFQEVGNAAKNASSQINSAFNKAAIDNRLFVSLNNLKDGFKSFGGYLKDVGGAVSNVSDKFQSFAGRVGVLTAAVTAAGYAFGNIAKNTINTASTLVDNANAAGISAEKYAKLEFTLGQMGVSSEKFRNLMSKLPSVAKETADNFVKYNESLAKNEEAARKSGKAQTGISDSSQLLAKRLRDLGVSSTDSEKFLYQLLDAAKKLGTEQERVALLSDVLGPKLGPRLAEAAGIGAAGVQKLQEQLAQKGFFPTDKELQTLERAGDSIGQFGKALEYLRIKALALVGQDIIQIFDDLTKYILKNQNAITQFASSTLKDAAEWIRAAITVLTGSGWIQDDSALAQKISALMQWKESFLQFAEGIKYAAGIVSQGLSALAYLINNIFGTNFTPSMLAAILLVGQFTRAFSLLFSVLGLIGTVFAPVLTVLGLLVTSVGGVTAALLYLASLIGGAALGAALVALVYFVYKNFDLIKQAAYDFGVAIVEFLKNLFVSWVTNFLSSIQTLQGLWNSFLSFLGDLWVSISQLIVAAWNNVLTSISTNWEAFISWLGSSIANLKTLWDGFSAYVINLWTNITNAVVEKWGNLTNTISQLWGEFSSYISGLWENITNYISQIWIDLINYISNAWSNFIDYVKTSISNGILRAFGTLTGIYDYWTQYVVTPIQNGISYLLNIFSNFGQSIYSSISNAISNATKAVSEAINSIISYVKSAIDWINNLINRILTAIGLQNRSRGGGYATGGYVSGPGTSTSDSIPAWLSNGEFVVRAAAVRKYGLNLFNKLNGLNLSESIQSGINGFAMGGLVGVPSPVLASSTGRPINLTIGNEVFAMNASDDVAERIIKYAAKRNISSAGRKPGWYGS